VGFDVVVLRRADGYNFGSTARPFAQLEPGRCEFVVRDGAPLRGERAESVRGGDLVVLSSRRDGPQRCAKA